MRLAAAPRSACTPSTWRRCSVPGRQAVQTRAQESGWNPVRFIQQVAFFNMPQLPDLLAGLAPQPASQTDVQVLIGSGADARPAVLVTGATGGLGRRVVARLLAAGQRVRVLARDGSKATRLLQSLPTGPGARLELVIADLAQPETLRGELFAGVKSCISCAAANIRPKGRDKADVAAKYNQGVKFYAPEIADDTPAAVDSRGVAALATALAPFLGTRERMELLDASNVASTWGALDDVVMGGRSESGLFASARGGEHGGPAAVFRGVVTEAGNGGFASVRSRNWTPALNLAGYDGLRLRVRGDGQRYKLTLRCAAAWDGVGYCLSVDTRPGVWQNVDVPFRDLVPVFRARTSRDSPPFDPLAVSSLQVMLSKFEYDGALNPRVAMGPFELPIESISPYMTMDFPRLVHVSSAGTTRPGRPDLAPEARTKIVAMNDALGGLLTAKLEGENAIRESGVPFAVVRSCALTEEPAGAPLEIEQGDNMAGKMSREDLAGLCVALLSSHAALDTTFEVKCSVPTSEPWSGTLDTEPRDWTALLAAADLKQGITGKMVGERYAGTEPEVDVARQQAVNELMSS